jgi:EAL domain-containing protein (putative c-di-GMP-specific phosphodiesterase class I)
VQNAEDIMDVIEYSADMITSSQNDTVMHASDEILWKKRRENRIEQALQHAIRENGFGVHYQPIYSVEDKCYRSAEALVRLYDEELGFISPEEFIPIAEKNGMILDIGEYVFRSVCSMMSAERLWEKGIDYIEVNLSVVQCMQEKLHEKLLDIMNEYHVPAECINLEITETSAAVSKETLLQNMERLVEKNVTFSLDDYGTGYSNITNIIQYPFHIIKLDKSMVWSAMEDERAIQVLRHTVAMLKDLNMHIVAEGVENEKQAVVLADMGCDYFQGYYYSKPVPVADFLQKIG